MTFESLIRIEVGGPLLVGLFYWFRFHTLKGTRSYTTHALYFFGIATFILPFVLIYYLLLPLLKSTLWTIWLLVLIWLTPVLPQIWRSFCHSIARIPSYAYEVRDALSTAGFALPPDDMPAIRRMLRRFGIQIDDFRAVQETAIQSRFLKIAAIMLHLEEWKMRGEAFMKRNSEQYSELLHTFDILSFKTVRSLKNTAAISGAIMEESKVQPDDWHALDSLAAQDSSINRLQSVAQTAMGCMLEDLRKDMDFMLENSLLFIARAALAGEWTFQGRKRRLETVGFTIARPVSSIMPTVATAVTVMLTCSLMWFVIIGHRMPMGHDSFEITRAFVLPSLTLIFNFLFVYHFKRNYAFANEGIFGQYPIGFILSIGILTSLLMVPFRVFLDHLQTPSRVLVQDVWDNGAFSLFPWIIGTVIAFLVQESTWSGIRSERAKRTMDGVVFGAGMTLPVLVIWAIDHVKPLSHFHEMVDKLSPVELLVYLFSFSFVIGFIIGYLVISRIREDSSLRSVRKNVVFGSSLVRA